MWSSLIVREGRNFGITRIVEDRVTSSLGDGRKECLYLHVTLFHMPQSHFRSQRQSASDTVDLKIRFSFCISFLCLWKQTGVREY